MAKADWVAFYAAIVASIALTWNVVQYLLEGRTRVRVELAYGMGTGMLQGTNLVIIRTVNKSRHPVHVVAAGIGTSDDPKSPYLAVVETLPG